MRRVEHPVQGERQLDRAEVGAEVTAVLGDGGDDEVADLAGQLVEVLVGQVSQVGRLPDPFEPHNGPNATPRATIGRGRPPASYGRRRGSELFDLTGHVRARHRRQQRHRPRHGRRARRARRGGGHLGHEPGQERRGRRAAGGARRRGVRAVVRRRRPRAAVHARWPTSWPAARAHRLVLRQRRRRRPGAELRRDDRRGVAPGAAGQPRRRASTRAQAATAHMVERSQSGDRAGGSIVFTSSGSAYFGQQHGQHYGGVARPGIDRDDARASPSSTLATAIRANAIVAGWTESEMTDRRPDVGQVRGQRPAAGAAAALGTKAPTSPASPSTSPARRAATTPATSSRSTAATRSTF